jgi:hypothetical protein
MTTSLAPCGVFCVTGATSWALEDNHTSLAAIAAYIEAFRVSLISDTERILK